MNVGEMQRKLSRWATQDKEMKFFDLYHLLYDKDWLRLAHDYVKQNAGSITAGCDGINMASFDEQLEENLQSIIEELKSETLKPSPVRRVYIPKPNGKTRPLGIPAIRDRIVQEALRMVLEPIFEADFSPYSFGFRPTRRTMDAIKCITWGAQESKRFFWIIEGDISSYFDTIHHPKLLRMVGKRIEDKKIPRLVWKFLRSGVMEKRTFRDTKLGTPQGGIISPLLANIYLNELDGYMERYPGLPQREKTKRRRQGLANHIYVR
jgi:RNA-directed DNA polymerase